MQASPHVTPAFSLRIFSHSGKQEPMMQQKCAYARVESSYGIESCAPILHEDAGTILEHV